MLLENIFKGTKDLLKGAMGGCDTCKKGKAKKAKAKAKKAKGKSTKAK
jgi:hypothetical protein